MTIWMALAHLASGWLAWSLCHNLWHRFWHWSIARGYDTFYTRGEKAHHKMYDHDQWKEGDPLGAHLKFPYVVIGLGLAAPTAAYTVVMGLSAGAVFAVGIYGCMFIDDHLHKLVHLKPGLTGWLGRLQARHLAHHRQHFTHYSFGTGAIWDRLFRTNK